MNKPPLFLLALRWMARIIGTLVVLLAGALAVGEGVPNPFHQPTSVNLLSLALVTMLAGQVVAWWREGIGGALVLAGFAGFAIINHGIKLNAVFAFLPLTGLLYLFCFFVQCRGKRLRP